MGPLETSSIGPPPRAGRPDQQQDATPGDVGASPGPAPGLPIAALSPRPRFRVKFPAFPYASPYPVQLALMQALCRSLDAGALGLFESPTGTGKTLTLMCGVLHWIEDCRERERDGAEGIGEGAGSSADERGEGGVGGERGDGGERSSGAINGAAGNDAGTRAGRAPASGSSDSAASNAPSAGSLPAATSPRRPSLAPPLPVTPPPLSPPRPNPSGLPAWMLEAARREPERRARERREADAAAKREAEARRSAGRVLFLGGQTGAGGGSGSETGGRRAPVSGGGYGAPDLPPLSPEEAAFLIEPSAEEAGACGPAGASPLAGARAAAEGTGGGGAAEARASRRSGADPPGLDPFDAPYATSPDLRGKRRPRMYLDPPSDGERDPACDPLSSLPSASSEAAPRAPTLPRLIFASRTHSQLSQFVREFRRTPFADRLSLVSLAGRGALCVNDAARRGGASGALLNERCLDLRGPPESSAGKVGGARASVASRSASPSASPPGSCVCPFKHAASSSEAVRFGAIVEAAPMDVEELARLGRRRGTCPYYAARRAAAWADVVLAPYASLLSREARESVGLDVRGAVVVFDEAHNLLDAIASAHAASASLPALRDAAEAVERYARAYGDRLHPSSLARLQVLAAVARGAARMLQPGGERRAENGEGGQEGGRARGDPAANGGGAGGDLASNGGEEARRDEVANENDVGGEATANGGGDENSAGGENVAKKRGARDDAHSAQRWRTPSDAHLFPVSPRDEVPARPSPPLVGSARVLSISSFLSGVGAEHVNLLALARGAKETRTIQKISGWWEREKAKDAEREGRRAQEAGPPLPDGAPRPHQPLRPDNPPGAPRTASLRSFFALLEALSRADADGAVLLDARDARAPTVSFCLLSPAAAFADVARDARAVVLASGTLAPDADLAELANSVLPGGGAAGIAPASGRDAPPTDAGAAPASGRDAPPTDAGAAPAAGFSAPPAPRSPLPARRSGPLPVRRFSCGHVIEPWRAKAMAIGAVERSAFPPSAAPAPAHPAARVPLDLRASVAQTAAGAAARRAAAAALARVAELCPGGVVAFAPSFEAVGALERELLAIEGVRKAGEGEGEDEGGAGGGAASVALLREPRAGEPQRAAERRTGPVRRAASGAQTPAQHESASETTSAALERIVELHARLAGRRADWAVRERARARDSVGVDAGLGAAPAPPTPVLLCVVGGRLSEGINFSDGLARAVCVAGIPAPDARDPELRARLARAAGLRAVPPPPVEEAMSDPRVRARYEALTARALNQAVGRAVRHAKDAAAVVLLDQRYHRGARAGTPAAGVGCAPADRSAGRSGATARLPRWLGPIEAPDTLERGLAGLRAFFDRVCDDAAERAAGKRLAEGGERGGGRGSRAVV